MNFTTLREDGRDARSLQDDETETGQLQSRSRAPCIGCAMVTCQCQDALAPGCPIALLVICCPDKTYMHPILTPAKSVATDREELSTLAHCHLANMLDWFMSVSPSGTARSASPDISANRRLLHGKRQVKKV
jgi:hypothetical protein